MTIVLVGSLNRVKIDAVREAFSEYYSILDVRGIEVPSQVPNQPVGNQTFEGAYQRALALKSIYEQKSTQDSEQEKLQANFFVGMEGGILSLYSQWFCCGAMCVMDTKSRVGFGLSSQFPLPDAVTKELLQGKELGDVIDALFHDHNSKQKQGAIGYLTKGVIDRKKLYVQGVLAALVPFLHEGLYFGEGTK